MGTSIKRECTMAEKDYASIPGELQQVFTEVVGLMDAFCERHLNEDYRELCREMAVSVCQAGLPIGKGKPAGWASAIVHVIGRVNFLQDRNQSPYMTTAQVAAGFGVSEGTMMAKSKIIRDELELMQLDPDWCLPALLADNPLVWMLKVNGFIMDIRTAPREAQEEAYRLGLIPFIPADKHEATEQSGRGAKIIKFPSGQNKTSKTESHQNPEDEVPGLFGESDA